MNPLNPTQEESLVSYSEQRDALLQEVKTSTQERDTLLTATKELASTNGQLLNEILENEAVLAKLQEEVGTFKDSQQSEIDALTKSIETLKVEKARVEEGLSKSAEYLAEVTDTLKEAKALAEAVVSLVENTKKEMYDDANTIANSAASVSRATTEVNNIVSTFMNAIIGKSEENTKKEHELEGFKNLLDAREQALDLAYNEIITQMKKDGKELSQLNKAA